jgi:hypothetical protein
MKKSKAQICLEAWLATLKYLDHHKVQGRILFAGVSLTMFLLAIKVTAPEIIKIIEALK